MGKEATREVRFFVPGREFDRLKGEARKMGVSFSAYMRLLLRGVTLRPPRGPELAAVLDDTAELAQSLQQGLFRGGSWGEEDRRTAETALAQLRELRLKIMEETTAPVPREVKDDDL